MMNTAYPLFPVMLLTFLVYFTTRIFASWEIFPLKWHRKFWNYLLLIAFLISGLLGILSVIKVNYKLEITAYETYLSWHVAFGIALVIIAFIHFSWHLKYYFRFGKRKQTEVFSDPQVEEKEWTSFQGLLFLLGGISIINQVVFIREFISVLSGNELVVGIILSAWMLITSWGAYHARKGNFKNFSAQKGVNMLGAISLFPIILIPMLYLLKSLLFPPGTLVGLGNTALAAFLLLFPVCFLSGYLFTLFSTFLSVTRKSNLTGLSYSLESLGSLAGGAVFTFILGRIFSSLQVFGITAGLIFLAGAWMLRKKSNHSSGKMIFLGLIFPALIFIFNPDRLIKKSFYPNQEILSNLNTRYGDLVITQQAGQVNVYQDNNLLFYTDNIMLNEEAVHFAMVQHKAPRNVLLLSGGMAGMVNEILKYEIEKIIYLETNPEIFRLPGEYVDPLPETDKLEIVKKDIRSFAGQSDQKFDIILINLPPPSSLGQNRFYTREFFALVKNLCKPGSIVSTTLPSTANYAEENALKTNSSLWKTLGLYFENRMLIPGEKNYFLASDSPLNINITERIALKNISTEYVNSFYLDDALLSMRSKTLSSQFLESVPVNSDFDPFMFVKQIAHWLSYFKTRFYIIVLIPVFLFVLFFLRTNRITAGLYTGGFTAAAMEIALLLAYQVYFGTIYLNTALFFSVFMGGLAFGSSRKYLSKLPAIRTYWLLQLGLAVFAVILPFLLMFHEEIYNWLFPVQVLFFLLVFSLASGVGYEFMLAARLREKSYSETSGVNYSTDLMGSALGAFLTAIVLLPLLGVLITCIIVAGLNIISAILAMTVKA